MTQITTTSDLSPDALATLMLEGDLGKLTPPQRVQFYQAKCEHVGLDPSALPFQYIRLQGKLTLYASKGCAEQLRKKHKISLSNMRMEVGDGYVTVTIDASTAEGRTDTDCGSVSTEGLKGEMMANAKLKAVTKAKRRVTLSLLGLGMLDETEVSDIPQANKELFVPSEVHVNAESSRVGSSNFTKPEFQKLVITKSDLQEPIDSDGVNDKPPFDIVEAVVECKTRANDPFWAIRFRGSDTEYTTFSKSHQSTATELMHRGSGCQFSYKQNGKYFNLTSIETL